MEEKIRRVAVVGTGTLGTQIAVLAAGFDYDVSVYHIEMVYFNESKDPKDHPPEVLKAMVDRKELGTKTQKGFYTYPDPEFNRPDFLKG